MDQSIITWNVPNFITVTLMTALGVLLFIMVSKAYNTSQSGK